MIKIARHIVAPVYTVATMLIFAAFTGCEKDSARVPAKDSVAVATNFVSRLQDPVYRKQLRDLRKEQVVAVKQIEALRSNYEGMLERARKVLPQGATMEQVIAELDANLVKYPGWKELKVRMKELEANLKRKQTKTRDAVRARILKEAADRKAAQK